MLEHLSFFFNEEPLQAGPLRVPTLVRTSYNCLTVKQVSKLPTYLSMVVISYDSLIEIVVIRPSCPHFPSN